MADLVDTLGAWYDTGANVVEGAIVGYAVGGPLGATVGAAAAVGDEAGIFDDGTGNGMGDGAALDFMDSGLASAAAASGYGPAPGVLPSQTAGLPVRASSSGPPALGPTAFQRTRAEFLQVFARTSSDPNENSFRSRVEMISTLQAALGRSNEDMWRAYCALRALGLIPDDSLRDEFLEATR